MTSSSSVGLLVLRVALGAIFLYHGLAKILPAENELGATWARNLWAQWGNPPGDLMVNVENIPGLTDEQKETAKRGLSKRYARNAPQVPPTLEDHAVQYAVAWGELLGGVAMILGFLTRVAAIGLIAIQVGAIALVTAPRGFSFGAGGGYEYNLALLAMCAAVVVMGPGDVAVDRWLAPRRKKVVAKPMTPAPV
jgi:uncharacterized membrane protein YphA (DoxX/SURF4 family)